MNDEKKLASARAAFATLCASLDANDWHYDKNEEELEIECGAQGEDLPMRLTIKVDADRQVVLLYSHLPFVVAEDKRLDVAIAVTCVNDHLVDGSFDFDIKSGHMFFRMTNSLIGNVLGTDTFSYMLYCSCGTIDDYNDKFLMLSKGMISLEQFMNKN